jgi:hypothetical protein
MAGSIVIAILLAITAGADATCYLLDANATCAVCWKTTYDRVDDKVGVTKMEECPSGVKVVWTEPPPVDMVADKEYGLKYSLQLDQAKFGHLPMVLSIE